MLAQKKARLTEILRQLESVVIGFSGGVDSTLLVKVSLDTLGIDNVWAVTGNSKSVMPEEYENCKFLADKLKLDSAHFLTIDTREIDNPYYVANSQDRCYFCKHELFDKLTDIATKVGAKNVLDGTNASDLGDYRPGMKAGKELEVRAPLAEAGFTKDDIRKLAKELGLPNWDKPSMPCLASRIPYNSRVTIEKLEQIAAAERYLRGLGFKQFRVRHHGKIARLELDNMDILLKNGVKQQINDRLKEIGFAYVTVDLGGYKSGSLNIDLKGR